MNKRFTITFIVMIALTLLVAALMIGCGPDTGEGDPQTEQTTTAETLGVSYPTLMTYEDYQKLSPAMQQAYYETFPNPELYMQWFNTAVQAYNQTAGKESIPEDDAVGEITQPTSGKDTAVFGNDTVKVPEQTDPKPEESANDPTKEPAGETTGSSETTNAATEPPIKSDFLIGWGGVQPGRE